MIERLSTSSAALYETKEEWMGRGREDDGNGSTNEGKVRRMKCKMKYRK